ncbi:hypothetical protein BKX93_20440 [Chromobacterium vaccinii]|uniref:Uncharacterized protein n=1 Tax=Chromobacterium vaccinii TaxID=1108595 RepID=A0A1D9LLM5_9NEIS|nr:hypothetical protein BKX93_20440 [Chromobacterium vaccinii]
MKACAFQAAQAFSLMTMEMVFVVVAYHVFFNGFSFVVIEWLAACRDGLILLQRGGAKHRDLRSGAGGCW